MVTPETRMCGDKIVCHAGRNVKSEWGKTMLAFFCLIVGTQAAVDM